MEERRGRRDWTSPGGERGNETGKVVSSHGSVELCEATTTGLVDDPREPCTGARLTTTCVAPRHVDASFNIFILVSLNEQHGGRGCALTDFICAFSFPWLADHERDWPPYETLFSGRELLQ